MMKLSALVVTFMLALPAVAFSEGDEDRLIGKWRGEVIEGTQSYSLEMSIERLQLGQYAGVTVYSGTISCEGLLTFERKKASIYVFQETINRGTGCTSGGRVEVWFTDDGYLQWEWYSKLEEPAAISNLSSEKP